jgi:hypothetical protein
MKHAVRAMLLLLFTLVTLRPSFAQVSIAVSFGPPPLPVYEQPLCPGEGYLWTPGYWAWDPYFGYYWVPSTWVLAPEPRLLWTPGWWGWGGNGFIFHEGYWAPEVGFYGGINYGYGYFGRGFEGGRWQGNHFYYNRAASNVNVVNVHNTYNTTIVNNVTVNRISYNGGEGGVTARPTPQEQAVVQQRHISPVPAQLQHLQVARSNPTLRASANQGKPPIAAVDRPAVFTGRGVVAAKAAGAPYHAPARGTLEPISANSREFESSNAAARSRTITHASDLQPHYAPAPEPNSNAVRDRSYEEQQSKLLAKQNKEYQQLAEEQESEHQQAAKQHFNQQQQQQMEERHRQQTQQMLQQHAQEQQNLKPRQKSAESK